VLIPIRTRNNTALETCGRLADAMRGLAAALTDLFALSSPQDAPRWESLDDMAWGLSDIAETLTRRSERSMKHRAIGSGVSP
jgi:hypothetical protein